MSKKNHPEHELPQPAAEEPTPVLTPVVEPVVESPAIEPKDQEIATLKDRLLRLQADFDNFRKRTLRDREDMSRRAAEKLLHDLLPIVDHLEMGLEAARHHHIKHSVLEGFEGILKQFQTNLEKAGVTPIETKDQAFDPNYHECVTQIASEEHPEGVIIDETRKGYKLGTYLLRASQVIVSTGPAKASSQNSEDSNQQAGDSGQSTES
ncbi:MAG: nucleotide exchange factor GrpE [bacterium]|jgi:molecular chaperone GrpE